MEQLQELLNEWYSNVHVYTTEEDIQREVFRYLDTICSYAGMGAYNYHGSYISCTLVKDDPVVIDHKPACLVTKDVETGKLKFKVYK